MADEPKKNYFETVEEQLQKVQEYRRQLRFKIKAIIEEETGQQLSDEGNYNLIISKLPQVQQQNIYGKIMLAQTFQQMNEEKKE